MYRMHGMHGMHGMCVHSSHSTTETRYLLRHRRYIFDAILFAGGAVSAGTSR